MKGHFYFIGITGHAIRGLALAVRERGFKVTGLDETGAPPGSDWLDERGIVWAKTFVPEQLDGVTAVIVTGAHATPEYPAIVEAAQRGIPVKSWAQLVGELTSGERSIVVAGTHGKTTTTSFITWLLEGAGRKPDFLVGIQPFNFDSSVRLAGSDVVVLEGDEYKSSSLENTSKLEYYHPDVMVLTSVEHDHPDVFPDLASVIDRFIKVVRKIPEQGRLVVWAESQTVTMVAASASCQVVTYGLEEGAYKARNIAYLPAGIEFDVETDQGVIGRMAAPMYGRHNVLNALAAIAVTVGEGLSFDQLLEAASTFKGAYRRFNILTPATSAVTVIDDYGHHPSEVKTMIEGIKLHFAGRRLVVVYRPHTYSRTRALLKEYQASFDDADVVYMTDVEGAREAASERTVSGADIVAGLAESAVFEPDRGKLADRVVADAQPGDVVLCMTVSGYDDIAGELAQRLSQEHAK